MNPALRIFNEALANGLTSNQANLLVAQAKHETGEFTSPVFLAYNNCFGMRPAQERNAEQLNYRSTDSYAHYQNIEQSVRDLLYWFDAKNFTWYDTPELYCAELKRHDYFTDTLENYSQDVSKFFYNG